MSDEYLLSSRPPRGPMAPSDQCFMPECGRPRVNVTDLLCQEHWRMVPKHLKQPLIDANKLRSWTRREEACKRAAGDIVFYLDSLKVRLPPAAKLETAGGIVKDSRLIQTQEQPKLEMGGKLIITDRR